MIFLLLIVPLMGVLLLLLEPSFSQYNAKSESKQQAINIDGTLRLADQLEVIKSKERIKRIALIASLINFFISIIVWFQFDPNSANYQFVSDFGSLASPLGSDSLNFCHFHVGVDGISLYFVLLTTFITPICILSNWTDIQIKLKYFLISFLVLETLQIAVFVVLDLFLFYVFFESVLIPLFFIVIIWGGSEKKYRAAFLLFLYTLAGSLFMLLAILFIYQNTGSTDLLVLSLYDFNLEYQKILWLAFFISFAVKTPLFPFHIWLFRAHAEAPLAGSIILAAVILKLATYGFLRVSIPLFSDACLYFLPLVQTVAALTIIYASLSTLRQIDSKQLVAMSSVAHMGVVILAIFSNNIQGIEGGILLGISHGFVSPALFICVGGIIYSRFHSRIIIYFKGLVNRMPLFVTLFFVFTLFNTAIPLSLNYIGEFLSLTGVYLQSPFIAVLGASGIVFSAGYSIWLFTKISYGSYSSSIVHLSGIMKDINRREFFLLLPLLLATIFLGITPNIILNDLHTSVSYEIYNTFNSNTLLLDS